MRTIDHIELTYQADGSAWFECVRHLPFPVFLDSGFPLCTQGRFDIIAADPVARAYVSDGQHWFADGDMSPVVIPDIGRELARWRDAFASNALPDVPFVGGALGYWGYDYGRDALHIASRYTPDTPLPEAHFGRYLWAVVVDHQLQRTYLIGEAARLGDVLTLLQASPPSRAPFRINANAAFAESEAAYARAFARVQRYLLDGDVYQINLAQRLVAEVTGDPWSAYHHLRQRSAAPFSAFLQLEEGAVLSFSPELFLNWRGREVVTKPIKGTRPRGVDVVSDALQIDALVNSRKDRAENVMIVDLLRNDLSKVCQPGSVSVPQLFAVETFTNVHHLVSTVSGIPLQGVNAVDIIHACLPCGSVTGAPKHRAMQIIDELEIAARGVYCGAIGYIDARGGMEFNVAIRTAVIAEGQFTFWAGGGIVADSDVVSEYQEILAKARHMIEFLRAGVAL